MNISKDSEFEFMEQKCPDFYFNPEVFQMRKIKNKYENSSDFVVQFNSFLTFNIIIKVILFFKN